MKLSATHLKRYRQIASLLWKYGRSDLAKLMSAGQGFGVDELPSTDGQTPKDSANRITMGVVLAGLIIGASLLMHVANPFQLFGFSGAGNSLLPRGRYRELLAGDQYLCLGLQKP